MSSQTKPKSFSVFTGAPLAGIIALKMMEAHAAVIIQAR